MPNIKSAIKRMKTSEKKRIANAAEKSRVRTARRTVTEAVSAGDRAAAESSFKAYCSMLDKAVKHGTIKANAANRRKSRLHAGMAALS